MMDALAQIAAEARPWLWAAALVFFRIGAAMALLPGFGERSIPARIRLALALAFTAIVAPAVQTPIPPEQSLFWPLMTEAVIGLALGAVLRLFIQVLQIAGTMAAQSTSLSQFFGGAGVDPQPAIAQVLMVAGFALAVATGLHVKLAQALILSYDLLPAGHFPAAGDLSRWGIAHIARAFTLAFTLAAPFVIAALIYNAALGAINKAMPQLMVAFVGAPALTFGGLALLLVAAPLMLGLWSEAFARFLAQPFGIPR